MDKSRFDKSLGRKERRKIRQRKRRYQKELEAHGFELHVATGSNNQFIAVLVIDPVEDRRGFLGPDGSVQWIDELRDAGIGALSPFVVSSIQETVADELTPSQGR